jgi:hypothetical protein
MIEIPKKYIDDENVDEKNKKPDVEIDVEIDIETFNKIEEVLEDYGLYRLMVEDDDSEPLSEPLDLQQAKDFYRNLQKQK